MAKSAVRIIMLSHLILHVLGQLLAPQNVKLTSVNFRYLVTWKAGAGSGLDTWYSVAACNLSKSNGTFIPVEKCTNISTLSCDLSQTFENFRNLYWVRVKSITSTSKSKWVESNELLPMRDTILGPPLINITSHVQTINITLDMPLTPHKDKDESMTVQNIDSTLIYILTLLDKDGKRLALDTVRPDDSGKGYYQFENLKSKSTYCVSARFWSAANKHTKDSVKLCTITSPQNADILWIALLIAVLVFIGGASLCCVVVWMLREFTYLCFAESKLPKSLAIISEDLHVDLHCKELDENLEGDHISFITHDDRSNDHQLEYQGTHFASKLQLTDESVFYESNGLSTGGYGHRSLMKETDICKYKGIGCLLPYMQSSIENEDSTSSVQQNSPGTPVLHNLQCKPVSSSKDTEEMRSCNADEYDPALKTLQHSLTLQEIHVETVNMEFWKWADVPLSSVKLYFNGDSEKDSEVSSCGDETLELLSTDDLCSQLTHDLTAATDQSLNSK
ncbi:interferon alpha/beta receptor 2-like [Mustelus asterias]